MAKKVLTQNLTEPLVSATSIKVDIHPGDGNMVIDGLTGGDPVLASGTLQYLENNGLPTHSVTTSNGQATFTLKASSKGQHWLRLPWAACNGATEWHIHLNPTVSFDITAHTDGGNVTLDLTGMAVTRVKASTSGGNMEIILAGSTTCRSIEAHSGAGNVAVRVPGTMAARITATSGLGKVIVEPRFNKIDDKTYQSPDYESAVNTVEITATSGAGNVSIG